MSVSMNNLFNFSRALPEPFDKLVSKKVKVTSKYGSATEATLSCTMVKAVHAVCNCMVGTGEGAVGTIDHRTVAEYKSSAGPDMYHLVVFDSGSGNIMASIYDNNTETIENYKLHQSAQDGAAVMMAMMPLLLKDDEFDENFVGMVFPNTDSMSTGDAELDKQLEMLQAMGGINFANVAKLMNLPDLDDMDFDPAGTFQSLTGVKNEEATSRDCMAVVMDMVTEKIKALTKPVEKESTSGQTYTYVETDFIKALKNGYVVEIQEPTVITQPGVLVGLNSLLEQTGSITLPTGEVIQRHPDTVVVVTTNITYEGCRGLNQSVVDRMSLVEDIELPDPDVMAQRAMAVTGATDEYQVSQMVQVVNDMSEYMRKNGITDGSCGMRSLIDWINSTEITGNPYRSALCTIISKATSDPEDRETLKTAILEPIFAPKRRKTA